MLLIINYSPRGWGYRITNNGYYSTYLYMTMISIATVTIMMTRGTEAARTIGRISIEQKESVISWPMCCVCVCVTHCVGGIIIKGVP